MPKVPTISPATGKAVSPHFIHTVEANFVDNAGRTVLLRGINLSGSDKAPVDTPSQILDDFFESGERGGESFVGRPLNIDDGSADVHLARLRGWGFNMLRYVVTWEALEHSGPGKYDFEFMDYTIRVLRKCKEYGFKVYMDPHQDTWSRYSGGSGAPYWTLLACGINPRNISVTTAAIIHCEYPNPSEPNPAELPAMIWSTNYGRLAVQTLFTLFFAGRDYAPKCIIDGMNIQDYLQSHYITAMGELADRIRDAGDLLDDCVIGWDSMNEPFEGFCGYPDLNEYPSQQTSTLKKGTFPTPAQSFKLGMGQVQTVDTYTFTTFGPQKTGQTTVDPKGVKVWSDPSSEVDGVHPTWGWKRDPGWKLGTCIWALHGIWDVESGFMITPDYFKSPPDDPDRDVVFIEDYWRPHFLSFASRIRQSHPEAILFVAPPVFSPPPSIPEDDLKGRCCLSTHYYDGLTLLTRHWNWFNADALGVLRGKYSSPLLAVKIGEPVIRKSLQEQLGTLQQDATILGAYPTIIGEIGIPYDMDDKKAYGWTDDGKYKGDFSSQQKALDASLNAADGPNALNYTIWTYCPDNSHAWGDGWNLEDLSVWSPDDLRQSQKYRMEVADASSAALLKAEPASIAGSAAASSVSLATLPVGEALSTVDESKQENVITSLSRWQNAYDFLTDGARAVKAFCRPYPSAIVGVPKDIQFNISKAEFKLTIRVRPEDAPLASGLLSSSRSASSSSTALEKDEPLATEIYLPLIHYASDSVISRASGQSDEDDVDTISQDPSPFSTRSNSSANLPAMQASWRSSATLTSVPLTAPLAVTVKVSGGRWSVEGQTLKWWYPVPSEGEAEKEYTISITREGGAIKTLEKKKRSGFWSRVCPKLCGGCIIM
ncbi:glycoside hydrolase superfamily [Abortiporus biennis]|nr:glycoside hydrolase superfamily [Abortiporus biennis]